MSNEDADIIPRENGAGGGDAGGEGDAGANPERPGGLPDEEPLWEPGVVEVAFRSDIKPEVAFDPDSLRYEVQSLEGHDLGEVNRLLAAHGLLRAEPTFTAPRKESARVQKVALQQDIDVPDLNDFVTLHFADEADVERIALELNELEQVAHAEPIPGGDPPCAPERDDLLGSSDQLERTPSGLSNQWYVFRCRADRAWRLGFTGRGVVLADIDWGFQVTHVELVCRLDPVHRHNSVDGSNDVSQGGRIDHGTAVMGLAGAPANGSGIVGFAHQADLWPIQANTGTTRAQGNPWARAIDWVRATDSGGKRKVVVLQKQAGRRNIETVWAVNVSIRTAIADGVVVCVPAGNGNLDAGRDSNQNPIVPTGSILVGATIFRPDANERLSLSNWGPRVVVSAPGDERLDVTCGVRPGMPFRDRFGATSGASAKVAGAVALMLEANPYIRHSDVRRILNRTGTHIVTDDDRPVGRFLDCEAAVLAARSTPAWGTAWRRLPGNALDLVFAPDGSAWHLGSDRVVYRWCERSSNWLTHGSTTEGVKLAVGASGNPWYVNAGGDIFRWEGSNWQPIPGQALDISVGANGSVWHVGTDNHIYRWLGNGWEADSVYSSAVKIAVEPDGSPWHISSVTGDIYRRVEDSWQQVAGQALDISVGANGSVWRVGLNANVVGNSMSRWSGSGWEPIDGTAAAIAVAPNGLPWHVNPLGHIFRRV